MYLLDTPVLYELRKAKAGRSDGGLAAWVEEVPRDDLFLSALSLIELEAAAARRGVGDKAGAAAIRAWVGERVAKAFDGRILAVDAAVVRRRAQLAYADARDGLMAATALEHGLTLATLRPKAFRAGRVKLFNPLGYTPAGEDEADWRQAARAGPLWLKNLFVRT